MSFLLLFGIVIWGIYAWSLYQIIKILHYEGHKYDKAYIQQKYEEGFMKATQIKLNAEAKRFKQAERLNRRINRMNSFNLQLYTIMRKVIAKYQMALVQYFHHEYENQTLKLQKNMAYYQKFLGDRSKDLNLDISIQQAQTP